MSESIRVVYEPLGTIAGVTYYHETLLYTNNAGQQYFATSGPSVDPVPGSAISNTVSAISDASSGKPSPYGVLGNVYGAVNDSQYSLLVRNQLNDRNPSEVVATGADLNAKWTTILDTEDQISKNNVTYSPITQNSNSEATTALLAAGITPPSDNGLFSNHWAPAAGNVLPTATTPASTNTTAQNQAIQQLDKAEADGNFTNNGWDFAGTYGLVGYDPVVGYDSGVYHGYYGSDGYIYDGYYGTVKSVKAGAGMNVASIAQEDLKAGDFKAADAAQAGHQQVLQEAALYQATGGVKSSVLEAAKWDQQVVTWHLGADSHFTQAQVGEIDKAFAAWAAASGLSFEQVRTGTKADVTLNLGELDTSKSGVIGYTGTRSTGSSLAGVRITLEDPTQLATSNPNGTGTYAGTGASFQQVVEHEIGHAIGLGDNADPDSIMFYQLTSKNRSLDSTDLAGLHQLYGSYAQTSLSGTIASTASADTAALQLTQALGGFSPTTLPRIAANEEVRVGQFGHHFEAA